MKKLLLLFSLAATSCSLAPREALDGRWVDLTHPFSEQTIYWPTAEPFVKSTVFEGVTDAGYYYAAYNFSAAEHGGTHIDAPVHFRKKGRTVDEIPVEQLTGPGIVIRIHDKVRDNRNYQLSVEDIRNWEKEHGEIPDASIVLIDTGSSKVWPDKENYMGTDERGERALKKLQFPGIHPSAARFLVEERQIKAVGLDTPSLDYGGSNRFETHQVLFEHDIPGFENVANLDKLPNRGAIIFALPMKIKGGSGGPLRIVALIPNE